MGHFQLSNTDVRSESELLDTVDDVLNEVVSHWVIDFVVLHNQLTAAHITTHTFCSGRVLDL